MTVFRRKATTVKLVLKSFEQFSMIAFVDGAVIIPNWEKYQNINGLEKIRQQTYEEVLLKCHKQKKESCYQKLRQKRIKNIVKQVFLTEEENVRLLALRAEEPNFSAYARKKLFNIELVLWEVSFLEYGQMTEQLIQIGCSINVIVKLPTRVGDILQ